MTSATRRAGHFTLVVQMSPEVGSALRERARTEDRSMSSIVRLALRRYLGLAADDNDEVAP
jgi:hypothetical protein